jgi:hypothetical protein
MPSIESTTILSTADAISVFNEGGGSADTFTVVDQNGDGHTKPQQIVPKDSTFGKMALAGRTKLLNFWGSPTPDPEK